MHNNTNVEKSDKSTIMQYEKHFRPNADPGEWCACLVPLCFFVSCLMNNAILQIQDKLVLTLSVFMTLSSFSLWYRIKWDGNHNFDKMIFCTA